MDHPLKQKDVTIGTSKFEYEWHIRDYFPEPLISNDFSHPFFPDDVWFMRLEPPASPYMLSEATITLVPKSADTPEIGVRIDYNETCLLRTIFEPSRQALRASFRVEGSETMIATSFSIKCFLCYPSKLCPHPLSHSLVKDVSRLLNDPVVRHLSPDFKLIACDGSSVSVHRLLLAARSPVFKALLSSDSLETQKGEMHFKETDISILRLLSDFVYSDHIVLSDVKQAIRLFVFADQYDLEPLKQQADSFICCNISNASEAELAIQVTERIDSQSVSKAAHRFLSSDKGSH